jgi:hypothetical protein
MCIDRFSYSEQSRTIHHMPVRMGKLAFTLCVFLLAGCAGSGKIAAALPTNTPQLNPGTTASPTPTPTQVIGAIEASAPSPTSPAESGVIWEGTINSQTQRQYMANGALVNTCQTSWSTIIDYLVDGSGDIHGFGEANLASPASCSPHPLSGNTENFVLKVSGRVDNSHIFLNLSSDSYSPQPSAELGGYNLLFAQEICPPADRELQIPWDGSDAIVAQQSYQLTMSGCAGSSADTMTSDNQITLHKVGDCANQQGLSAPELGFLCSGTGS